MQKCNSIVLLKNTKIIFIESDTQTENRGYEPATSTKDYSQPLYCKICHVDCSSEIMFDDHMSGKPHKKKMTKLGMIDEGDTMDKVTKATLKNVKTAPKFVSLEEKLRLEKHGEPVIGLNQIEIIKPRTNPGNYEPKYRCKLCVVTTEIDPIYQHLIGRKHRKNYIKSILGKHMNNLEEDIKYYAKKYDDKDPKQMYLIESDSEYESVMPSAQVEKEKVVGKGNSMNINNIDSIL